MLYLVAYLSRKRNFVRADGLLIVAGGKKVLESNSGRQEAGSQEEEYA